MSANDAGQQYCDKAVEQLGVAAGKVTRVFLCDSSQQQSLNGSNWCRHTA